MTEFESLVEKWHETGKGDASLPVLSGGILNEAEKVIAENRQSGFNKAFWFEFLDTTRTPRFLNALGTQPARDRWAEVAFRVIRHTNYDLRDMMEQRVAAHPGHILFKDMSSAGAVEWTYDQIYRHLREIAGLFFKSVKERPRVAVYTENCLEGACTDLACLMFDIYDTPLSPHFKADILVPIVQNLQINIALADTEERLLTLQKVKEESGLPLIIFSLFPPTQKTRVFPYLVEHAKQISRWDADAILARQPERPNNEVATTMFTSGSTGLPKGVSFSIYNIVSKRFARAAAVPEAGNEVFLCYLPLYHTFGRYLELTGAIFWDGTYVFAGNTSAETLLSLFPKLHPTGFISIPLRWQELYERCQELIGSQESPEIKEQVVRDVVGSRLHWGLSAAGYLDPGVFRFFNDYGIHLNSGFGMTEATGGITMTPPGSYREFSVGVPLPGVRTRLGGNSELEISGHYIAAYLETAGPGDTIPYPVSETTDTWLKTGDVFRVSTDGYYEIVDRVKDIYKNNRGQTVAPQVIEKKFNHVPGIRRVFLVGDNRPYNVLLIVPDTEDPLYSSLQGANLEEYYHQIVMTANTDVAPYERVINFAVAERDFSQETGELTPKGSYNRKAIETNFRDLIETLYQSSTVRLPTGDFSIVIPKWFYRDLGILETDILFEGNHLVNRRDNSRLLIRKLKGNWYQVGHFKYRISADQVDLGLFTRQPRIWLGNPGLIRFCPVREGWDLSLGPVSPDILLPGFRVFSEDLFPAMKSVRDQNLALACRLIFRTYFSGPENSREATEEIGKLLVSCEPRLANAIRHRLEALAYHPDEEIRCLAYRLILLKAPKPEDIHYMPSFIESGLTFLNEGSIREIAASNFGKHRLDALKQRLYWYRTHLRWPASKKHRSAFEDVLRMLFNFAVHHLEYYVPVRAELSRWILHKEDPYLSKKAEVYFYKLAAIFQDEMESRAERHPVSAWRAKLVFEHGITDTEKQRITGIFRSTTFLEESIVLTFNEKEFSIRDVPDKGIWILRLLAFKEFKHYRLSINTTAGKHFDLHMVMSEDPKFKPRPDTFYWLASLGGFPYGPAVAPILGSSRPELGVLTTQYIGGLSAWDKIRELSEIHRSSGYVSRNAWKRIFIHSFAVIFRAWHHSGYQIVPGAISPGNASIPEMDFRGSAVVLSLAGWSAYRNTLSLINPILQDYYCKIASIYPLTRKQLEIRWIFDACVEALGKEEATRFLEQLRRELKPRSLTCFDSSDLQEHLDKYLADTIRRYYLPVAIDSAVDHYQDWYRINPLATAAGKEQTILELMELYRLGQFAELARYYFYRHTYFADAAETIRGAFDHLLERIQENPEGLAIQHLELSDLQSELTDPDDKNVFSRMVFPRLQGEQGIDFLKVGDTRKEHLVVRFPVEDKTGRKYLLREPVEPRETGQLYQLFFRENYPKEISDHDHQFVLTDADGKIVGGITYRYIEDQNVLLDGIVVASSLQGKGLGSGMIERFFASMAAQGAEAVKAHFLFGNYYLKHFFEVDKKWGALIKTLK